MIDYTPDIKRVVDLKTDSMQTRHDWLKGLILLASTLFGVLVSFRATSQHETRMGLLLALSITLLGLGILCLGIALYEQVYLDDRMAKDYCSELQNAYKNRRPMKIVTVKSPWIFEGCRKTSYVFFALSVLSMCAYSILEAL